MNFCITRYVDSHTRFSKKMKRLGIKTTDKKTYGWGEKCPFSQGDIYYNPKSPNIKVMIMTTPKPTRANNWGFKRMCWVFDALVLRNGKFKLQSKRRVFHNDMKNYCTLEDKSEFENEKTNSV